MEGDRIAKSLGIYAEKYSKARTRKSVDFAGEDHASHLSAAHFDEDYNFSSLLMGYDVLGSSDLSRH